MFSRTSSIRVGTLHALYLHCIERDTSAVQFINMQIGASQNVSHTFISCNQPSFNSFLALACNLCSKMREKIEVRKGVKKQEREREWDQNNQQLSDEELIGAAKPEPKYCSGTDTTGVSISKECLDQQAHHFWANEYIIVYSKWNRSNKRKTHLIKSRHSS